MTSKISKKMGSSALLVTLLALPINAGNFQYYDVGYVTSDNAGWDGEIGTSDGGITAWTYVSYYNPYRWSLVEMKTRYTTSNGGAFTTVQSYGPAYLTDQDTGTLWDSSTAYLGESIAWRLDPSTQTVLYPGAWGVWSQ